MDLLRRLHHAIQANDGAAIQAAMAAGADVDQVWGMQGTALCQAIQTAQESTVCLLLQLGCDVNGEDFDGGFPLSLAIRKRLPHIALLLVAHPACDLNALDPVSKQRPLCSAVLEGLRDVVEALVQEPRCDITQGNGIGNTALHLSLLHRQEDLTRILARCQGMRFLPNMAGHAPLHILATLGDCRGLSLLYPSPSRTEEALHPSQPVVVVEQRAEAPANPVAGLQRELDQRVKYTGDTALHLAVREGHQEMARRLMALGAAVTLQNNLGQTALLLACAADATELVVELLRRGAPPDQAGCLRLQRRSALGTFSRETSLTPLHVAASSGLTDMVRALCDHGAAVEACDQRGRSALHMALLNGAGEVAVYLLDRTPDIVESPLQTRGQTLLHAVSCCADRGALIAGLLLERGLCPHRAQRGGSQPLHEALCWENEGVARVLLLHGADPNAPGETGSLPLAVAARTGHVHLARMLLGAGADLNGDAGPQQGDNRWEVDSEGVEEWSPLREALQAGMVDFARYLVDAGCDLSREKYLFTAPDTPRSSDQRPAPRPPLPKLEDSQTEDSEDENSDDDDDDDDVDDEDAMPDVLRDDAELLRWLREAAHNPHPLLHLSMQAVRAVFRQGDPPFALMLALPLPEKVVAMLLYRDAL